MVRLRPGGLNLIISNSLEPFLAFKLGYMHAYLYSLRRMTTYLPAGARE